MSEEYELPAGFCRKMEGWLGSEWRELRTALNLQPAWRGVRLHRWSAPYDSTPCASQSSRSMHPVDSPHVGNPVVPSHREHAVPVYAVSQRLSLPGNVAPHLGERVAWTDDGFYVPSHTALGKTIYHEAGAFYMQEPSAMAVVQALQPRPGERILDLCAAPGGKTTAIGARMRGQGVLVANEIHPSRVLVLAQNMERTGVPAVITNESPARLADAWHGYFDAILVDAPCSGEGMFRKEPEARLAWQEDSPIRCAERQRDILRSAARMVRPGGRIVYSTCTLNPMENEQVAAWAVKNLPLRLEALPEWLEWSPGRPEWGDDNPDLAKTRRLWPHIGRGEGHFTALFYVPLDARPEEFEGFQSQLDISRSSGHDVRFRNGKNDRSHRRVEHKQAWRDGSGKALTRESTDRWMTLASDILRTVPSAFQSPVHQGNILFAPVSGDLPLNGLKVLRPGIPIADAGGRVVVPHHALAMSLNPDIAVHTTDLSYEDAVRYLGGETLPMSRDKGWHLVQTNGLPLGWGKAVDGRLNNNYPKGLRKPRLLT